MKKIGLFLAIITMFAGTLQLSAQNTLLTYQGCLMDNGTNFTGMGRFGFVLVTSTNSSSPATASGVLSGNSPNEFVTSYIVTAGGSGYTTAPAVTVTGGGGGGATATAQINGSGVVTSVSPVSAGTNYSSTPTVTIAPPPANIVYTTFWSNDGTSVAGSDPATPVDISVSNGLFSVVLGDTTLTNMMALPAALFTQPNLQLRIWFTDGSARPVALNPAQNLTATPYAAFSVTASNLSGIVTNGNLPSNANFSGTVAAASFSGSGAGLTSLNANNLSGTIANSNLPSFMTLADLTLSGELETEYLSSQVIYSQAFNLLGVNTFLGASAGDGIFGDFNVAIGYTAGGTSAGFSGSNNIYIGTAAGFLNNPGEGDNNIGIGKLAGSAVGSGSNNIDIGNIGFSGDNGVIRIGTVGTHTKAVMNGIFGVTVGGGATVQVNSSGLLGTVSSSARFKTNIQTMASASDVLLALRPVTFQYKTELDPEGTPQFGLIAEEVEKVDPDLVLRDDKHQIYTVRYEAVNAMLLNEFLKEHSKIEEQNTEIQNLKQSVADLKKMVQSRAETE